MLKNQQICSLEEKMKIKRKWRILFGVVIWAGGITGMAITKSHYLVWSIPCSVGAIIIGLSLPSYLNLDFISIRRKR